MTQPVVITEHNVITPVSTDANGDVVTDPSGNPAANAVIATQNTYGKDREHITLTSAKENGTFTEADNATKVIFRLFITAPPTTQTDLDALLATAWVCFDPPTDAIGDIWLAAGDHTSDDAMRRLISILEPLEQEFDSYLTSYRIVLGTALPAGMTIGCTVEVN